MTYISMQYKYLKKDQIYMLSIIENVTIYNRTIKLISLFMQDI